METKKQRTVLSEKQKKKINWIEWMYDESQFSEQEYLQKMIEVIGKENCEIKRYQVAIDNYMGLEEDRSTNGRWVNELIIL